jgi:5-methylcytosine-specific restriction endonuclease McrA
MKCGSSTGYNKHLANKETPCQPCKEAQSQRAKEYRAKNLERLRKRESEYNKANAEKRKTYIAKWIQNNKDKVSAYSHKKRALRNSNNHEPYTIQDVTDQYGTDCHICNKPIDMEAPRLAGEEGWENGLHLDHVIPLSKGGEDNISNVKPSHARCNIVKGNKLISL